MCVCVCARARARPPLCVCVCVCVLKFSIYLNRRVFVMVFVRHCGCSWRGFFMFCPVRCLIVVLSGSCPVSILYKSIAGRYRPVRVADGPITARYRFIKNASWVSSTDALLFFGLWLMYCLSWFVFLPLGRLWSMIYDCGYFWTSSVLFEQVHDKCVTSKDSDQPIYPAYISSHSLATRPMFHFLFTFFFNLYSTL